MSMNREEAVQDEYDGRCLDRRSISFPGKIGESPDDWPAFGPVPYEDEEEACPCACHWHEDDGRPWHIKPCCDQPIGSRLRTGKSADPTSRVIPDERGGVA